MGFTGDMTDDAAQHAAQDKNGVSGATIAIIAVVAAIAGVAVFWALTRGGDGEPTVSESPSPSPSESASATPSPSITPSPDASPTPPPVAEAALTDADGRWCPTTPADWENACITMSLPEVRYDDAPSLVEYVAPEGTDFATDPSTWDLDVPANQGDCWLGTIDVFMGESGAAFIYCPAGAEYGEDWVDDSPYVDEDRIYITQDLTEYPYVREN